MSYQVDYIQDGIPRTKIFLYKDLALLLMSELVDSDTPFQYSTVTRLDRPTSSWEINDDEEYTSND
jgi:hypothetical protein